MVDFKSSGNPKKENVLRIDLVYFIKKVKLQDSISVSGQVLIWRPIRSSKSFFAYFLNHPII
ncbi:hypothetical protein [Leptospira borgpetersenii]|uniref:hypothetical protein n=1 Tax=Leptospira borgpetersenii TaxID=174 RepID=UPI000595769D|nr:hypothetical protein [Leptospira borgpetersenii]AMX70220.1 hypothetical protein LBHB_02460 [Leptospira borgpetersenii serovar Hardjo]TQE59269.1 hypothetical protein FFZ96_00650 [Leptospira borgpetersenii]